MIIFYLLVFFSSIVSACEVNQTESINFSTSPKDKTFFAYRNDGGKKVNPIFRANNCTKIASTNKYLMISFGPQNQELSDRIKAFDIANRYRDSGCFIQHSPFSTTEDFSSRKKYLEEKWHAIKSCYEVVITEMGSETLDFPDKQPGCQYQILAKNKLSFNGGFCFLKPSDKSDYNVEFKLKDKCIDYEGLNQLKVKVTDFQSVLNFYSAKDPSGGSIDLTSLSSFPLRFTVSPNETLFPSSDIFHLRSPEFPSDFYLPDTHMGTPEAESFKEGFIKLRLPLWANNKCQESCSNGLCQGLCDYAQPLVGNIRYFDISKERPVEIESTWFQGGVVLPRYQGEISGRSFELREENFKVGNTYRIVMSFNDPKFDFDALKFEFRSKLQTPREGIGSISNTGIPTIPQIRSINTTNPLPEVVPITDLDFSSRLTDSFEALLNVYSSQFSFSFWPPFFNNVCSDNKCLPLGRDYLTLTQEFKVLSFDKETRKFNFEVKRLRRESPLLESYEKIDPKMPKIFCKR